MADPKTTTELDVEDLMAAIQRRVNEQPDVKAILAKLEDNRRYVDGICEPTTFDEGLMGRVKALIYKCLMRVFKGNFERQRLFNHALLDSLQLIAEDMYKLQKMLPSNNDKPK